MTPRYNNHSWYHLVNVRSEVRISIKLNVSIKSLDRGAYYQLYLILRHLKQQ